MKGKKDFTPAAKSTKRASEVLETITTEPAPDLPQVTPAYVETALKIQARKEEYKSRRLQLLIKPSLHNKLKEIAELNQVSVNELINQVLQNFIEKG